MSEPGAAVAAPRRRRLRRRLLWALATLAALSLFAGWLLQPQQLVPLILDRTGEALALEIVAGGAPEARLRGTPQVVVRDLVVREPGAARPILRADRLLLALPWSTLRARGADPVVRRVELDAPVLDLPALQAWLAKRPPSEPPRIPTLTDGLRIVGGRIVNGQAFEGQTFEGQAVEGQAVDGQSRNDWRIEDIAIDLPALHPGRPLQARVRGRFLDAALAVPFDLALALSAPANDAGFGLVGPVTVEGGDWRLPARVKLSGPLHFGEGGIAMVPAKLALSARYESGDDVSGTRLPFALALQGPLRFDGATWALAPAGLALRGASPIPELDARGGLGFGERLVLRLDGALPRWPDTWPALPAPVSRSGSPLPFALRYAGAADLSDPAELSLRRDATAFEARFRLREVLAWTERGDGPPLPPLDGRLVSPRLEVSGATLEGVDIALDDETLP